MNSSLLTCDRRTHIKIVAVSLIAVIAVVVVGISAPITNSNLTTARVQAERTVINAGKPVSITANDISLIR